MASRHETAECVWEASFPWTADLLTEIPDFRGFDSCRILTSRGGILTSRGNFPEMFLSQRILVVGSSQ